MRCPVCDSSRLYTFLRREQVPVHQNLIVKEQMTAVEVDRGDLRLVVCQQCGFIFNASFDLSKLSYGPNYDNTQTHSSFFSDYVDGLVRYLLLDKGIRNRQIVEVGCGKGYFLRRLIEAEGSGNTGYGFDPSYVGPAVELDGRLHFEKRFYDAECVDIPADVVICRHVIEHVPDPIGLLRTIRSAMPHASGGLQVFFETPSGEWILQNRVFWDFFYEHCSYFTAGSLGTAFERAGFQVQDVRHIFGGQYLWLEATAGDLIPATHPAEDETIFGLCERLGRFENRLIEMWRAELRTHAGRVALWGAGAKGVTLANLVDPGRELIACVVDLNPQKVGGFIPGTGHPIVSHLDLPKYEVHAAILTNPNYRDEILAELRKARLDVDLVDPSHWRVTR